LKKKWLTVVGVAILAVTLATVAFADNPIKLIVNGHGIMPDVSPQIINGRTMVPIRWVGEALGADVEWDEGSRTVFVNNLEAPANILNRLKSLEPEQPQRIEDDWNSEQVKRFLENNELSAIKDLQNQGKSVSFEVTSDDDTWTRPVYSEAWHSTFMGGKFSDISLLVSYAKRNAFVYTGGLSEGSGLYYRLGFAEDWDKPIGGSFFSPEASFELWLISYKTKEIKHLNNEWLVVVEPQLSGYQTVKINYSDADMKVAQNMDDGQLMLFRIVTPEGYELERTAALLPVD